MTPRTSRSISKLRRRLKPLFRDAIDGLGREGGVPPRPMGGLLTGVADPTQLAAVKRIIDKLKKVDEALDKGVGDDGTLAAARLATPLKDLESVLEPREAAPKLPAAVAPADNKEKALAGEPKQ